MAMDQQTNCNSENSRLFPNAPAAGAKYNEDIQESTIPNNATLHRHNDSTQLPNRAISDTRVETIASNSKTSNVAIRPALVYNQTTPVDSTADDVTAGAPKDLLQNASPEDRVLGPGHLLAEIGKHLDANPIGLRPEGHYLPDAALKNLLQPDVIRAALNDGLENNDLIDYIRHVAPKTFATLQLVFDAPEPRKQAMQELKARNFTDEDLDTKTLTPCCADKCTKDDCGHYFPLPLSSSSTWNRTFLKRFQDQRSHFLVPELGHKIFRYTFDSKRFLPLKAMAERRTCGEGYFSDVECVHMLADKQTILPISTTTFIDVAHKTLKPKSNLENYNVETEWHRETEAHKQLNGRSPHLVQGVAAYRQKAVEKGNDTYHIILEWANGGNLQRFWESDSYRKPQLDTDLQRSRRRITEVLEQLLGLTEAVDCMHTEAPLSTQPSVHSSNGASSNVLSAVSSISPSIPSLKRQISEDDRQPQAVSSTVLTGSSSPGEPPVINEPETRPLVRRNSLDHKNWRHGDIKPENILRFIEDDGSSWLGTLKLADLGRAQKHDKKTQFRNSKEIEDFRTIFYEPPDLSEELHQQAHGKISRLFDVWSMGCVIFESVICMLYGYEAVIDFQKIERGPKLTPYWARIGPYNYKVTDKATQWMNHILKHDEEFRASAIGDLITLVKDKLLQIDLPQDSEIPERGKRTNARDMRETLSSILKKASIDPEYLFDGIAFFPTLPSDGSSGQQTSRDSSDRTSQQGLIRGFNEAHSASPRFLSPFVVPRGNATNISQRMDYTDVTNREWQYPDDHLFAGKMLAKYPIDDSYVELCENCEKIDLMGTQLVFKKSDLDVHLDDCDLCALVSEVIDGANIEDQDSFILSRDADHFILHEGTKVVKLLRVCCAEYGKRSSTKCFYVTDLHLDYNLDQTKVSIGARHLFTPSHGPNPFWELPKAWLSHCDQYHGKVCGQINEHYRLPKRLVDVRRSSKTKLVESKELDGEVRYIAFSHKWGTKRFEVTTVENVKARMKCIPPTELPTSFKDVIAVTKSLGCNYLWIDSLCINQGTGGDFDEQADDMQQIYSNAYCVIAASSANGATEGFLSRESKLNQLPAVKVGNVFVSAITNDFTRDVLQSPLHRRGWVLQEHALARRTIFFTTNQMYWECGHGVRCETLRKLKQ